MQIVVANNKGGCGKSTIVTSLSQIIDCDIVDHDNQGTLRVSSSFTDRNKPVESAKVSKPIVIHDTPPYNSLETKALIENSDIVIIPCKVMFPDLLACKGVIDSLRSLKMSQKGVIVFNDVRKPYTNIYKEIKGYFFDNYKDIKKAKQEISSLTAFAKVFVEDLKGKALDEIKSLAKELNII